jgi:hypothetical protein
MYEGDSKHDTSYESRSIRKTAAREEATADLLEDALESYRMSTGQFFLSEAALFKVPMAQVRVRGIYPRGFADFNKATISDAFTACVVVFDC